MMTKSFGIILLASMVVLTLSAISPKSSCQENETNFITIDDMKSLSGWEIVKDANNSEIETSIADSGLKISYNLSKNHSWADIYKDIDFANMPKIERILFQFSGTGAPNSLELKLVYVDGSTFGYARNKATNSSDYVSLDPWQITYWWGGNPRPRGEPVDFAKVTQMHFAISNRPEKEDVQGEGFVIISSVVGEKKQPEPAFFEKNKDIIVATITGLFGLATGLFVMRYRGNK